MKVQLWNKLVDIAKTKKDGVYTKEGWHYFVKNGNIGYVGNKFEGIYFCYGMFRTPIWERDFSKGLYDNINIYNAKIKELKKKENL